MDKQIPQECLSEKSSVSENKSTFKIEDAKNYTLCCIKVDDCWIKNIDVKKCDYLFYIHEPVLFIFVELKGSDIKSAFLQIEHTFLRLKEKIKKCNGKFLGCITASFVPNHANQIIRELKMKALRDHQLKIEVKNKQYNFKIENL